MRLTVFLFCVLFLMVSPLSAGAFPTPGKVGVANLSDDHCIPCKMMSSLVSKMQQQYGDKLEAVTINALKAREAAAKYAPQTLPTLIFFNRAGEEVSRHAGIMDESALRAAIDKLLSE